MNLKQKNALQIQVLQVLEKRRFNVARFSKCELGIGLKYYIFNMRIISRFSGHL